MAELLLQEIAFYDITRTGELLSRLSEDTQIIKNAATTNLSEALRNLSTAFIGLGFMFATSWKLTREHLIIEAAILLSFIYINNLIKVTANMFAISPCISTGFGCCTSNFYCGTSIWSLPW